jgi:hypothetical protein
MKQSFVVASLLSGLLAVAAPAVHAQNSNQSGSQNDPYAGQSHPPSDDVIVTSSIPAPKPPAGQPLVPAATVSVQADTPSAATPVPAPDQGQPQPTSPDPGASFQSPQAVDGTDGGLVQVAPSPSYGAPVLSQRSDNSAAYADPDGDIVHPRPLQPGELQSGSKIWVHLLDRLSTAASEKGDTFRSTVAMDVFQGSQVLVPAGSEIDGRVVSVSSGHVGGRGTMRLQPEVVILPDGARYQLHADLTGTLGSKTHVVGEGTIRPDSRIKRDSIEYGGAVGVGVVTGAVVAGPAGALTGGLIGAGAVTVHLLVNHPQATLESGTTLIFELTDPPFLTPAVASGN